MREGYHRHGIAVRGGFRIPLHRHLARGTGVRAVIPWPAWLVRTHGPAGVLHVRSDGDQAGVGGELALSAALVEIAVLVFSLVVMAVVVAVSRLGTGE